MHNFVYTAHPARVIFGAGTASNVADEVRRLGRSRVLLLGGEHVLSQAELVERVLGTLQVARFDGAVMHTPVAVTEQALRHVTENDVDAIVAVGGGSTTGLAKALAVRTGVDQVILPTTYAGSEVTPVLGETADGVKSTRSSPDILPETVIYDVEFTATMPIPMAVTSAVNALAHAVEALYAVHANPIVDALALEAIAAIGRGIPALGADGVDLEGRSDLLLAAWLSGTCLASVGMGLHHKLCHVLGGSFDLPHAATHTVVLPHVMAYNAASVPGVMTRIAAALETDSAPTGVYDLIAAAGVPTSLEELGLGEADLDEVALLATEKTYPNPREVTRVGVRRLLSEAFAGARPA
ncbi:maleylacetate reductase [Rhodococcus chondri]|uniref:Maleylacetate reductase n=1 Tax=Rhodococcus chondri TaxID=3065941 RepID=A0ABU7JP98_9NOCA|nr:maleylacetate reductase [Rhodococcus sp. CC-R104]MEE2031567.1 maleylacetate reductase [Rhodococcus sp. CC-R104]